MHRVRRSDLLKTAHEIALHGRDDLAQRVGYDFEGATRFDKLFTGIATPRPASLDPHDVRGTETIETNDTFDGDSGAYLNVRM